MDGVFEWINAFIRTPGFGGLAALAAAVVAFVAARRSRLAEDRRAREARWWEQARWAADLVREPDPDGTEAALTIGIAALGHLTGVARDVEAADFAVAVMDQLMPEDLDTVAEELDTEDWDEEDAHG